MTKVTAVLLAAGQGTRMKSDLPKVLHPVIGRPMVSYGLEAARQVSTETPVMVIGHEAESIKKAMGESAQFVFHEQ